MVDLFGAEIMTRSLIDQEHGFLDFWKSYPPGPRRTAKPQCLAKWIKLGCANNALHIISHVEYMKTQECWQRGFHPATMTYLNQQRWLDYEPEAPKPKQKSALEKILEDDRLAVKPSAEIRDKLKQLGGRT
jgi:hypothetical protein